MKQDFTRNTKHSCSIASQAHMPGHVLDCRIKLTKDSVGEAKWSARNSHTWLTWPKQPHPRHVPVPSQWSLKKSQSIFEGLIQNFHEDLFVFIHLLCKASFIPLHPFCTFWESPLSVYPASILLHFPLLYRHQTKISQNRLPSKSSLVSLTSSTHLYWLDSATDARLKSGGGDNNAAAVKMRLMTMMMTWIPMIVMRMMILKLKNHRLPFHHQGVLPLQIEGIMKKFKSAKEHTQRTTSSIWTDSCTVWSQLQLKHPSFLNTYEYHDDLRPPTSFAIRRGRLHTLCNACNKCFMKCFHIWFILTCNECLWNEHEEGNVKMCTIHYIVAQSWKGSSIFSYIVCVVCLHRTKIDWAKPGHLLLPPGRLERILSCQNLVKKWSSWRCENLVLAMFEVDPLRLRLLMAMMGRLSSAKYLLALELVSLLATAIANMSLESQIEPYAHWLSWFVPCICSA